MSVLREVWTGELLKSFRQEASFLTGLPNYSGSVAGNNTIHLVDVGADPAVLVNNTTYPIATSTRPDGDVAISLNKFDTTNTKVSDDELHGLSYDKIRSVNESHVEALEEATGKMAIHSIAPASDAPTTPVATTVAAKMGIADIRAMKRKFDDAKIPQKGRRLVLCPKHVEELLETNETFEKQYSLDNKEGKIGRLLGFDIFEFVDTPVYNGGTKQPWGAASAAGDKESSVAFFAPRMFAAQGQVMLYHSKSEDNPETRESVMGYRLYDIVMPKKSEAIGAIISQ